MVVHDHILNISSALSGLAICFALWFVAWRSPFLHVYIFRKFAAVSATIYSYFFDLSSFPPQVRSVFAGYDTGMLYALNPCAFLFRCQQQCGSVYRVRLGAWRFVILTSGDYISSFYSVPPHLFRDDTQRGFLFISAGLKTDHAVSNKITHALIALADKVLSPRSLRHTTQGLGPVLLSRIKDITQGHGTISLSRLTEEPLYDASNLVLFGSTFPADTRNDFSILNKSMASRMGGTSLWHSPSFTARTRLLKALRGYLQQEGVNSRDGGLSRSFMQIFKDNNIQSTEGAQLALGFLWVLHSTTGNNAFFSISFLLGDPDGFSRVRTEVDSAVEKFGSLERLVQADPDELDDPSFKLLTSAIMETMRFTNLSSGVQKAARDFDLTFNDGRTILIKEGENVLADMRAAHMDEEAFPNPKAFVVDRFARNPYRRKHLQTEGSPFFSLGHDRHICKGRWLAIYELKILLIILLYSFDFSPAKGSSGWTPPRVHPRSAGSIYTEDTVFVRLSPRVDHGV